MLERHPLGSQAFMPLEGRPYLVVVARRGDGRPGEPVAFMASGAQGVSYARGTWHHPLVALGERSDFLVVDRGGSGVNLAEYVWTRRFSWAAEPSARLTRRNVATCRVSPAGFTASRGSRVASGRKDARCRSEPRPPFSRHDWVIGLCGIALLLGGGWLVAVGGSAYYVVASLLFLGTALSPSTAPARRRSASSRFS